MADWVDATCIKGPEREDTKKLEVYNLCTLKFPEVIKYGLNAM